MSSGKKVLLVLVVLGLALFALTIFMFMLMAPMQPERQMGSTAISISSSPQSTSWSDQAGSSDIMRPSLPAWSNPEFESRDGGFDVAYSRKDAAQALATEIRHYVETLRRRGRGISTININLARREVSRQYIRAGREYQRAIFDALEQRGLSGSRLESYGARTLPLTLDLVSDGPLDGPTLTLKEVSGPKAWCVVVDEDPKIDQRKWNNYYYGHYRLLQFISPPAAEAQESTELAIDVLAQRLRTRVFEFALSRDWVDYEDEAKFRQILTQRYGRELFSVLGEANLEPLVGDEIDGRLLHRSRVSWTGEQWGIQRVARSTSQSLIAQQRAPWIRLGLACGTILMCVLLWLRIDWWLKGHYTWVTRFAMAVFGLIVVRLIWMIPFDV